jgi:hypothetical protein
MAQPVQLTVDGTVRGVTATRAVSVVGMTWHGSNAIAFTYKADMKHVAAEPLYRKAEWPRCQGVLDGVPNDLVRGVTENARVLKFEARGFEEA